MASINISPNIPFINLFRSDYPSGIAFGVVQSAIISNTIVQINNSLGQTIINHQVLVSPSVGFSNGSWGSSRTYTVGVAYEVDYGGGFTEIFVEPNRYTIEVYYVDNVSVPSDTTPPIITPKGSTDIVISTFQFSSSTTFINTYFNVSDPESGVSSIYLNPNIDWATPRAKGSVDVVAINGDGLSSSYSFFLTIVSNDVVPPTLSLSTTVLFFYKSSYPFGVSVNTQTNSMLGVATAIDNNDPNPTIEFDRQRVELTEQNPFEEYGLRARDNVGNVSQYQYMSLYFINDVDAPDTEPPTLSLSTNVFNFNVSQYPDGVTAQQIRTFIGQFITVSDNSNGAIFISYLPTIQDITEIPIPGTSQSIAYQVRALDESNNASPYVSLTVNYINDTLPVNDPLEIVGASSHTFLLSENRTLGYLLTLYTLTGGATPVSWYNMDTTFAFNQVGTYPITLQAIDGNDVIATKNITVTVASSLPVQDTTPPTIIGQNAITIYVGDNWVLDNFLTTYYTITDPSGIKSRYLSPSINFGLEGTYLTTIFAIDNADNVATKPITITILPGANPNAPVQGLGQIVENIYIGEELVTNKVKLGFTFSDKIDVELDSATIIIPYTTKSDPYKPFTQVKFFLKNVEQPMVYYVSDDSVSRVSSATPYFNHSIVLIEPTKILERFKCVDMTFTQPIDNTLPSYTLFDVINRISYNNPSRRANDNTTYWDTIDATLSNLLASIKAPQLQFRSMTIREALDRTFQYINAVGRLRILNDGTRVLDADFFNTLDTKVTLESVLNITKSQGSEFYAENSELTVENATTEYATVKFPSNGWAGVRADSALVNSENYRIEVPFPIYEILSIKLFLQVSSAIGTNNPVSEYKVVDITPYVLEKQKFDTLPPVTELRQFNKELHTYNTLYFTRGDNKIFNLQGIADTSFLQFLNNRRTIDLILDTIYGGDGYDIVAIPVKYTDILFQIEYRTLLTSRLRFMRDVKEDFFGTIHTNQMENIVDLEGLGANARGVINRVGNPDLNVTKIAKNWDNAFKVGQFTEDGFIATNVENAVFNDHIRSTASFTKNYNGLSKFVGVDTEIRQIPIPLQTIKSTVHYSQFVLMGTTLLNPIDTSSFGFAQNNLINLFANYLKQFPDKTYEDRFSVQTNSQENGANFITPDFLGVRGASIQVVIPTDAQNPINIAIYNDENEVIYQVLGLVATIPEFAIPNVETLFEPNKEYRFVVLGRQSLPPSASATATLKINYIPLSQMGKYMVNFTTYNSLGQQIAKVAAAPDIGAVNNSLKIDFGFNNNLSAGFKIETNYSGFLTGQQRVLYTTDAGRFDFYSFNIAELIEPLLATDKILLANRLPNVVNNDFQNAIIDSGLMRHRKDPTENFGVTYQIHFLPTDDLQNHLVVGKKFLTNFLRANNLNDTKFKLYISETETYGRFDNDKAKGVKQSNDTAYTISTVLVDGRAIRIVINANVSNAKSFAIGNENGDLVIGFNRVNPNTNQIKDLTTIYLNFTDKRS